MNGPFESASCAGRRTGQCLRQMAQAQPIKWTHEDSTQPYTITGELGWSNYTVSSDVLLEKSGSAAEILGRVGTQGRNNGGLDTYHLRLSDTGACSVLKTSWTTNNTWIWTTLTSGTVSGLCSLNQSSAGLAASAGHGLPPRADRVAVDLGGDRGALEAEGQPMWLTAVLSIAECPSEATSVSHGSTSWLLWAVGC